MAYRIVGKIKNKKYVSRSYLTEQSALKAAYSKVYTKDGTTKRKYQLHDFTIEKVN